MGTKGKSTLCRGTGTVLLLLLAAALFANLLHGGGASSIDRGSRLF